MPFTGDVSGLFRRGPPAPPPGLSRPPHREGPRRSILTEGVA